jgi:sugar porter (SP) family MFS transporter
VTGLNLPEEHGTMAADTAARSTVYLWYLVLIATVGPLHFGYHLVRYLDNHRYPAKLISLLQAELNAPAKVIRCEKKSSPTTGAIHLPQCIPMDNTEFAIIQSIFTLGGLFGALIAGPLATRYGRLLTMRLTTIFFILGPAAEALAPNMALISLGRFLSGVGSGAATVVCPIYVSEISPLEKRGLYGAFTQVMVNVGILTTLLLGYFLSHGNYWRLVLAVAGMIGVVQFFGLLGAPETPKWLAEHKKTNKARQVLQRIRGEDANIEDETKHWKSDSSEGEEEALLAAPSGESPPQRPAVSFMDVVRQSRYRRAVIAVVAVMAAQQLTGINSIMMYSVSILGGLLPTSATLLTVAVSVLNVIITLVCAPLADKIGRKSCLLLSITGMGISSAFLALGLEFGVSVLSAIATLTFVASFGVGLGPVPFILASELVGPEAVGATQSWALAANWIATFAVAQFFPIIDEAVGGHGRVYWLFAGMALLLGSFISWWVPETNGKASADEVWGYTEDRRVD